MFALNEDFKKLVEEKTSLTIHDWWNQKGDIGKQMNGLRLVRNRITHSFEYYWSLWDLDSLVWLPISLITKEELERFNKNHIESQFYDYQDFVLGKEVTKPLISVLECMEDFALNLTCLITKKTPTLLSCDSK